MTEFNPYQAPLSAVDGRPGPADLRSGAAGQHTPAMVELLRKTRPWVLFLAILGFVSAGFMALGGVTMVVGGALASATAAAGMGIWEALLLGSVYLVGGAFYGLFAWLLIRYSLSIGRLLATDATEHLEAALDAQRVFWKVSGVTAIIVMLVTILGSIAAGVAVAVMAASSMP